MYNLEISRKDMELIIVLNNILNFIECDYQIESLIVQSGQRIVFKANHKDNGESVVLKASIIIPVNVARIKREISLLQEIDSEYFPKFFYEYFLTSEELNNYRENLSNVTDVEKIETFDRVSLNPILITVEEYVPNLSWQASDNYFTLDQKNCVIFMKELFNGLNILWEKKIVHRDLKPDNILIRQNYRPTIIDLGIAKNMNPEATGITHYLFPSPCTPAFAAMEQLTNSKTEITYKTDQFAVGVIFYLILTRNFPYGRIEEIGVEGVVENMKQTVFKPISEYKNDIVPKLDSFIQKLLQNEPYKRFRTHIEIQSTLDEILRLL
jgi:serine/threonine protein kinase